MTPPAPPPTRHVSDLAPGMLAIRHLPHLRAVVIRRDTRERLTAELYVGEAVKAYSRLRIHAAPVSLS